MTTSLDTIFKAYDIRGVVPEELDADLARSVGAAFAKFTGAPRILVGRDARLADRLVRLLPAGYPALVARVARRVGP